MYGYRFHGPRFPRFALLFTTWLAVGWMSACATGSQPEADESLGDTDRDNLEPYCVPGAHWENGECVPDVLDDDDNNDDDNDDSTPDGDDDLWVDGDEDTDLSDRENEDEQETTSDGDDDLWIDGDEELDEEDPAELSQLVPDHLAVGTDIPLTALVDGETVAATWESDNEAVATVEDRILHGVSAGDATIQARYAPYVWPARTVQVLERSRVEARGIWVNRWAFSSAADVATIMERCRQAGFNQVYFQVRGIFDAYYNSSLEPWATRLSGTMGQDPGWDPLQTAIEEAHERGMELHAWINVFTAWDGSGTPSASTTPHHALYDHPNWRMADSSGTAMPYGSGYVWVAPGIPAVRERNVAVAVDIATRYDVDGIHLDRVRYPSRSYSFDAVSIATCQAEEGAANCSGSAYMDWQRRQVDRQVAEMYEALREAAPRVVLSAAVFGIYTDSFGWNGVTEGYEDWLQDPKAWDEQESIDVIIPMIYWTTTAIYGDRLDFRALTDDFAQRIANRFLYIGSDLTDGSAKEDGKATIPWAEIEDQIDYTRQPGLVEGWVLYDYGTMNTANYWQQIEAGPFAQPALVPFFWWK